MNYDLYISPLIGSELWNIFLSDFNYIYEAGIAKLGNVRKQWEGPKLSPSY